MAEEMGISHTSVQRIWAEHGLKPHCKSARRFTPNRRQTLTPLVARESIGTATEISS
jgi:hypothetical protein